MRIVPLSSLALSSFLSIGFGAEAQDTRQGAPGRSFQDTKPLEMPFTLVDGYLIVVEGSIGSHEHLRMALDTGATFSVLRARLASSQFERQALRVANLDRVVAQEAAMVADFQLGPIRRDTLPMMLSSLDYLGPKGASVDAVIGLDVLEPTPLTIDFAHKKLFFGEARRLRSAAPINVGDAFVSVEIRTGDHPLRLILDSGVPSILLYRDRLDDRRARLHPGRMIAAASLGGSTSLELVDLPPVKLGRSDLGRRAAMLKRSPSQLQPGISGYLALAALDADVCSIDFAGKTLSWQ